MSAPSLASMADHLIAHAGASPDPQSAALLAGMVMDRLRWQNDGGPPVVVSRDGQLAVDPNGVPKTVGSLISDFRREIPQLFTSASQVSPVHAAAMHGATGLTARAAAEHAAAQQREIRAEPPNPYVTGNRTQIVLIEARDPARAAQLKAAAGV